MDETSALLVQKCELHIQVHYCIKTVQQENKIKDKKGQSDACLSQWLSDWEIHNYYL